MGSADKIISFIILAVIGVQYFMNIVSVTLGIVLLVFAGVFVPIVRTPLVLVHVKLRNSFLKTAQASYAIRYHPPRYQKDLGFNVRAYWHERQSNY